MTGREMVLADLVAAVAPSSVVGDPGGPTGPLVRAVAYDSRTAGPGALFCCVRGEVHDGHVFAADAVRAGAVAILAEAALDLPVPQLLVDDARVGMARAAAAFWGEPSRRLDVIGVTGTNGKTTVTHLLQSVLEADGRRTGVIGTLSGARTTPEAPDLQAQLAAMVDEGYRAVAMEVSSHALTLHRPDGTHFAVAVFTNLSRDHLDFHETMAAYFQAKARLFTPEFSDRALVNIDDPHGRLLADAAQVPTTGYSVEEAERVELGPSGTAFVWQGQAMHVPLPGRFNLSNALAVAHVATLLGVPLTAIAAGLAAAPIVPGRFERVDAGQPFTVAVDYAHTPDGLEQLLTGARELTPDGRVVCVFGCGGDRDATKRPRMGAVAARLADVVVLTSDNPRSEDPLAIIEQVREGAAATPDGRAELLIEADRRSAIATALHLAEPNDIVLVAGKGHEATQTVGDEVRPFDDRLVVLDELDRLGWTRLDEP